MNLKILGLEKVPIVLQFNKRDVPDALAVSELQSHFNKAAYLHYEAQAQNGKGVFDTLKGISKMVLQAQKY